MIDHLLSHLHGDPARIRAVEEHEISALASHANTVNTYRIERRGGEQTFYWRREFSAWTLPETATIFSEVERNNEGLLPPGGVWVLLQTSTLECHGCGETQVLKRSAREVAEKAYAEGYMVHQGNVLCRSCQER